MNTTGVSKWAAALFCLAAAAVGFFGGVWTRDYVEDERKREELSRFLRATETTPDGGIILPDGPVHPPSDTDGLFR